MTERPGENSRRSGCIEEIDLDRFHRGLLSAGEEARLREHLGQCAACRQLSYPQTRQAEAVRSRAATVVTASFEADAAAAIAPVAAMQYPLPGSGEVCMKVGG